MEQTPFNLVFDALWELVKASRPMQRLVSPGNFITFADQQNRDTIKQTVGAADLPELTLVASGVQQFNLHASSCSSMIVRDYSFILATGDYRVTEFLLPVQFALFCSLASWQGVLSTLQWKSKTFVTEANWVSGSEGLSNEQVNRGIKGWSSLWTGRIVMHFATADLKAYNAE